MTKWTGVLGGGAAGAAVVVAGYVGLTLSGVLSPDTPDVPPAALSPPDPEGRTEAPVPVAPEEIAPEDERSAEAGAVTQPETRAPETDETPDPEARETESVAEAIPQEVPEGEGDEATPGSEAPAEEKPVPGDLAEETAEDAPEAQVPEDEVVEVAPASETPAEALPEVAVAPETPAEARAQETPEPEAAEEETAGPAPDPEGPAEEVAEGAPDPETPAEDLAEATVAPEAGVEAMTEPEVPVGETAEVSPDRAALAEEKVEVAPRPEVTAEEVVEAAPEPEPPAAEVVEAKPEPEAPLEETVEALPEPDEPVTDFAEAVTETETKAPGETEAAADPDTADSDAEAETSGLASDRIEPETAETADTPDTVTAAAEDTGTRPLEPPTFDLIRVEQDGAALVAGKGAPRAEVTIFLDGDEIAATLAGSDGKFASLMDIAPSPQPRLMTLSMTVDGARVFSETEIIVAPFGPKTAPAMDTDLAEGPDDTIAVEDAPVVADPDPEREPGALPETPEAISAAPVAEETAQAESPDAVPETSTPDAQDVPLSEIEPDQQEAPPVSARIEADPVASDSAQAEAPAPPSETEAERAETLQPAETVSARSEDPAEPTPGPGTPPDRTDRVPPVLPAPETPPEAEAPPRLLASDENGVRVLPGPEVLDRVAIDTISYDDAGDVALAGRGAGSQGGGFVRVYLDNTPITTSRIRPDGSWRVTLPEVDKGVYVLRVDEVDDEGEVKSRAETPFQREDRETLEKAAEGSDGAPVKILTVQPGNTLWQIARERYGEGILYVRVFEANRDQIRDPDLIYPGQVFDLPEEQRPPAE